MSRHVVCPDYHGIPTSYLPEASHMESSLDLSLGTSLSPADESKSIILKVTKSNTYRLYSYLPDNIL